MGSPLGVEILEMVLVGWVGGSPPAEEFLEILEIFFLSLTGRANLGNGNPALRECIFRVLGFFNSGVFRGNGNNQYICLPNFF